MSVVDTQGADDFAYIRMADGWINVVDGAGTAAGSGCETSADGVRCGVAGVSSISVSLGAGNDDFDGGSPLPDGVSVPLTLDGGAGNDRLRGGRAADTIRGGDDDDTLDQYICPESWGTCVGAPAGDDFSGGAGIDTVLYYNEGITASLDGQRNDGNATAPDLIRADVENLSDFFTAHEFTGDDGPNVLTSADLLNGGMGADTLGSGATAHGGEGDDEVHMMSVAAYGDGGDDRLSTGEFNGGPGEFNGDMHGGPGDDVLISAGSQSTSKLLDGGPGDDTADFSRVSWPTFVSLDGAANDGFFTPGQMNVMTERVIGGEGPDTLIGGAGDDIIDGGPGGDVLGGGDGSDRVEFSGRTSGVTVDENGGADDGGTADGHLDNVAGDVEELVGTPFDDTLTGGSGTNVLSGEAGNDILDGGPGADRLSGGPGTDRVTYARRSVPVEVTLDGDANDGTAGENDWVGADGSVEDITGGSGDDTLIGEAGPNRLDGGKGDDVLDGGNGPDHLIGGDDADAVDYSERTTGVQAALDGQAVSGNALDGPAGSRDTIDASVEALFGGAGADSLTGNDHDNLLDGGLGADHLIGSGGDDVADYSERTAGVDAALDGRPDSGNAQDGPTGARDTIDTSIEAIFGGDGPDRLTGNGSDNLLDGGPGSDRLIGGGGEDVVDYSTRAAGVVAAPDGRATSGNGADGGAGARDTIATDIEDIFGGDGADRLSGSPADNVLVGFGGDDRFETQDNSSDGIDCGDGADFVHLDDSDFVTDDCETVEDTAAAPATTPVALPPVAVPPIRRGVRLGRGQSVQSLLKSGLRATVTCARACEFRATLLLARRDARRAGLARDRSSSVLIGRARGRRTTAGATTIAVRPRARARRKLRHARRLHLTLVTSVTETGGKPVVTRRKTTLRRRGGARQAANSTRAAAHAARRWRTPLQYQLTIRGSRVARRRAG